MHFAQRGVLAEAHHVVSELHTLRTASETQRRWGLLGDDVRLRDFGAALHGSDRDRLIAIAASGPTATAAAHLLSPTIPVCETTEELLAVRTLDAVALGSVSPDEVPGVRQLFTHGVALAIFPSARHALSDLYELVLSTEASELRRLYPVRLWAFHPTFREAQARLLSGACGRIEAVRLERRLTGRSQLAGSATLGRAGGEPALAGRIAWGDAQQAFLEDVGLLSELLGTTFDEVLATRGGSPAEGVHWLQVTLGDQAALRPDVMASPNAVASDDEADIAAHPSHASGMPGTPTVLAEKPRRARTDSPAAVWSLAVDPVAEGWSLSIQAARGTLRLSGEPHAGCLRGEWITRPEHAAGGGAGTEAAHRSPVVEPFGHGVSAEGEETASAAAFNPYPDLLADFAEKVKNGGAEPIWNAYLHHHEILGAIERSIARRRTIDLFIDPPSERAVFKTQMAAGGCGVLIFTLLAVVAYLVVMPALPIPVAAQRAVMALVFTPLVLFLLLQGLLFVTPPTGQRPG